MPPMPHAKSFLLPALAIFCLGGAAGLAAGGTVTNLAGLRAAAKGGNAFCDVRLEAVVCSVSASGRELVLLDDSSAEVVRLDLSRDVRPGQKILIAGAGCELRPESWGVAIVPPPLIDNDGLHGPVEKSAKIFLPAGRVPVRVEWFNASQDRTLKVGWQPPGGVRENISARSFFRRDAGGGWTNGLDYRGFEGSWKILPEFENLAPVTSGTVSNFTMEVTTRHDFVGLVFNGFLQTERAGEHQFFLQADDGARLFVGEPMPPVTVESDGAPPVPSRLKPGVVLGREMEFRWAETAGVIQQIGEHTDGVEVQLNSADGPVRVLLAGRTALPPELKPGVRVIARGVAREAFRPDGALNFGILEAASVADVRIETPATEPGNFTSPPMLLTAAQIERLSRGEAAKAYPARIRGVITCDAPELNRGSVIQDQTRGIYIFWSGTNQPGQAPERGPRQGEFWEVEGITQPGKFAPVVQAVKMTRLGESQLPAPVAPAWDQLLSGALDTQFVEMQGIITDVDTNGVVFLTHGGKIRIDLTPPLADRLRDKKNSLMRLRGCLLAVWDGETRQVKLGEIRLASVTVTPDAAEPVDPFGAPQKNVDDLLRFDVAAGSFQRVNISGQVVAKRGEEMFMLNGARGLRFVPREPENLKPGDLVEVAGFPELDGPSPVLREAVVRRTGFVALPAPVRLMPEQVAFSQNDSLRVQFEAVFNGARAAGNESLLDLQVAGNYFSARLRSSIELLPDMVPGSRVALTGVYVSLLTGRGPGHHPGAFEILVSSPDDVRVIARPPWWTLRRALALTGALFAVLILAALWITQLRRRVEERTEQLRHEISGRERAEQQRMVAEEKSRIARDLHDDLGASLTEIGLQADVARRAPLDTKQATEQFGIIADKTRAMVSALDVIVWAVDPEENTLQATAEYVSGYAEEFLSASGVDRRFKIPMELPAVTIDGHTRHGIFLAVKEALNNIVRHARATVVEFGVSFDGNILRIEIADNGVGFDTTKAWEGYGVESLHKRLENLGGKCQIESRPGSGTKIEMILPVEK